MRRLTDNVFCMVYGATNAKIFSLMVAIIYITVLNTIIVEGIFKLLNIISASLIHKIFSLPYLFVTVFMICIATVLFSMPLPYRSQKKRRRSTHVFVYTVIGMLVLVYEFALK